MKRTRVESSAIRSKGYDPKAHVLEIAFRGGGVYDYAGVSRQRVTALEQANSKGRYFNRAIKGSYSYRRVK